MKKYQIADFIFWNSYGRIVRYSREFQKVVIDTDEEVQVEYFLEVVDKLPEFGWGMCITTDRSEGI